MKRYWYTYAFVFDTFGGNGQGNGRFKAPYAKVSPGMIRQLTEYLERREDVSNVTITRITRV